MSIDLYTSCLTASKRRTQNYQWKVKLRNTFSKRNELSTIAQMSQNATVGTTAVIE